MQAQGSFVTVDGTPYYKISNVEGMAPFFIQMASACDIWLFMSSFGGVTAGRRNAEESIFPYETDDRLHHSYETGSKTVVRVGDCYWQPFAQTGMHQYQMERNLYKGYYGNSVMLEEINHTLGLSFAYRYTSSEAHGIIKTSYLRNIGTQECTATVLDGLANLLPYGVNSTLQATTSNLVDAYKAAELVGDRLGVYSMTTHINDTPNPVEVLRANVAYTTCTAGTVTLNPDVVRAFYAGNEGQVDTEAYGKKGAFYVLWTQTLVPQAVHTYHIVCDVAYDHAMLRKLEAFVQAGDFTALEAGIQAGTEQLTEIVAQADGVQTTGDTTACAAHYLNTLYNVMRGGTFANAYQLDAQDFIDFANTRVKGVAVEDAVVATIRACATVHDLKQAFVEQPTLYRLALEYMPLSFSRRHGDPSRPWNKFNIRIKDENGKKISNYEGNWRDIFQNWEALGLSYPCYYENMVAKFVNASTIDGFNPYRINKAGIDWEKPEEDNPFGGYGYWGDHQIVYLLRLLHGLSNHFPEKLAEMLHEEIFTYANVPYILNSYDAILANRKDTITFDFAKDAAVEALCAEMGTDGKLVQQNGATYTVSLTEKLLVPVLSKMSNLFVGGGIWMNTQRPEWNDANNAIVGIGLSMITVYHVKAYLTFLQELFANTVENYAISAEVIEWLQAVQTAIATYAPDFDGQAKPLLDQMGQSFSAYRGKVYTQGFAEKQTLLHTQLMQFLQTCMQAIDYTIAENKGDIYATYNLLGDDFTVSPMADMLEGQSAVIGSGCLSAEEISRLLGAMETNLLDAENGWHTLYPVHKTTRFVDKNAICADIPEIAGVVEADCNGALHFVADLVDLPTLCARLEALEVPALLSALVQKEFERVFGHKKFTGRSQVMYKFEGIGCVYWHQNAKLALAVLEGAQQARKADHCAQAVYNDYKKLMQGFIYRKTPAQCGAIPIEPYSHTSFNHTSEQPGMTGQVKESVIMRRGELGIGIQDGQLHFDPWFLSAAEFDANGKIACSVCGVPVVYEQACANAMTVQTADGMQTVSTYGVLDAQTSAAIFARTGAIKSIHIAVAI